MQHYGRGRGEKEQEKRRKKKKNNKKGRGATADRAGPKPKVESRVANPRSRPQREIDSAKAKTCLKSAFAAIRQSAFVRNWRYETCAFARKVQLARLRSCVSHLLSAKMAAREVCVCSSGSLSSHFRDIGILTCTANLSQLQHANLHCFPTGLQRVLWRNSTTMRICFVTLLALRAALLDSTRVLRSSSKAACSSVLLAATACIPLLAGQLRWRSLPAL